MKAGFVMGLASMMVLGTGCATRPETVESRDLLSAKVERAVALFKARDPSIQTYFNNAYAYAVLPEVTKGALVVGGAFTAIVAILAIAVSEVESPASSVTVKVTVYSPPAA